MGDEQSLAAAENEPSGGLSIEAFFWRVDLARDFDTGMLSRVLSSEAAPRT
jgi:hypothetical protein